MASPATKTEGPPGSVVSSRPCLLCGYNLRGLPREGHCPECGLGVDRSLPRAFYRYADRPWLGRLRRGVTVMTIGIIAAVLGPLVLGILVAVNEAFVILAVITAYGLVIVVVVAGWWIGTPDLERPSWPRPSGRALPVALRTASVLFLIVAVLLPIPLVLPGVFYIVFSGEVFAALLLAAALLLVAIWLLGLLHLRWIALQTDPRLARASMMAVVVATATPAIGACAVMVGFVIEIVACGLLIASGISGLVAICMIASAYSEYHALLKIAIELTDLDQENPEGADSDSR